MKRTVFPLIALSILFSCTSKKQIDFPALFSKYGVHGTFVLESQKTGERWIYNPARLDSAFLPASTFKIPNSILALHYGAVADTNEIIKWSGQHYEIPAWNRDHNLNSAIKVSVVWFYQEIARRIGEERMQEGVNQLDYGNKDIAGDIDKFWLNGGIRISANQQIDFLKRFYAEQLPFPKEILKKVKGIMLLESGNGYKFYAKTGWSARVDHQIGWYVGFIETNDDTYFFAINVDVNDREDLKAREGITKDVLKEMGLMR